MLDAPAMKAQLKVASSEAVAQIYDASHDCEDATVHEAALDILWDRHAVAGRDDQFGNADGSWATSVVEVGNPNDYEAPRAEHKVVTFCAQGADPWDTNHQVKRTLIWAYNDDRGLRWFKAVECTCGRRSDLDGKRRLDFRRRLLHPTARVWPTVVIDGIPNYQVCKFARCADDSDHCPNSIGTQCFCGGYLGPHNMDGKADKLLPAY